MISFDDGKQVRIDAFMTEPTYNGLVMAAPNDELNAEIINKTPEWVSGVWGDLPTHVVIPRPVTLERDGRLMPVLPNWKTAVRLDGPATDGKSFGGFLVVVWFDSTILERSIESMVQVIVKGVDWSKAKNYDAPK